MSQKLCARDVRQAEFWPWRSSTEKVDDESDVPFHDPFEFDKYIRDQASPEKTFQLLARALHIQTEKTMYFEKKCNEIMSDQLVAGKAQDIVKKEFLELVRENDELREMLHNKTPQHLGISRTQTTTLASPGAAQRKREQQLFEECRLHIHR